MLFRQVSCQMQIVPIRPDVRIASDVAAPVISGPVHPAALRVQIQKQLSSSDSSFELDVTFSAAPGFAILFGASGAGKTTLLDCIAGLATPDKGRIVIGDTVLFDADCGVNVSAS